MAMTKYGSPTPVFKVTEPKKGQKEKTVLQKDAVQVSGKTVKPEGE